ncbi:protein charybde-like [Eriocheir sinensis]|uniref:protein charybde-like n=1 Tax=Eriocheir sinensis TaxID=95602 RepID=UPI0021CA7F02|nr:protein charybde-like [Eriocheir sinensis]
MAHLKVLTPGESNLVDLLGPLPTEEGLVDDDVEALEVDEEMLDDPVEVRAWAAMRRRVEEEIKLNTHNSIVYPPHLLDQVAEHVLELSKDEPCGLRGCVLFVVYQDPELGEQQLAKMKADRNMPSTHLLVLKLKADPTSWYTKMARIFRSLGKRKMVVSPKYELLKKNFYDDPQVLMVQ